MASREVQQAEANRRQPNKPVLQVFRSLGVIWRQKTLRWLAFLGRERLLLQVVSPRNAEVACFGDGVGGFEAWRWQDDGPAHLELQNHEEVKVQEGMLPFRC
jgi:hypothetical protein